MSVAAPMPGPCLDRFDEMCQIRIVVGHYVDAVVVVDELDPVWIMHGGRSSVACRSGIGCSPIGIR